MGRQAEIKVRGAVNGVPIEVDGRGAVDASVTRLDLRFTALSLGWDHALLLQPCADLLSLASEVEPPQPLDARCHQQILDDMEKRRQLAKARQRREEEALAWKRQQESEALWASFDPSWLEEAEQAQQRAKELKAAKETRDRIQLEVDLSAIDLDQKV